MQKEAIKSLKHLHIKGFSKNPSFYFGVTALLLFSSLTSSCIRYDSLLRVQNNRSAFLGIAEAQNRDSLFVAQEDKIGLETPDLKIIQDNTISGVAVPSVVSARVLGDTFGAQANTKEVIDYTVQTGDTFQSIATAHHISLNTLLWANDLTATSKISAGKSLVVLPVDGLLHVVKEGDTLSTISSRYKAKGEDIIAFNDLANQDDLYIGDILLIPGGTLPAKSNTPVNVQVPLADNYFIFPAQGRISQGLHYFNAIDLANQCGTPVYAAAGGTVQRVVANGAYNKGMGNYVTILHGNGTSTYYGHLMSALVKPGDRVDVGQNIGLMGRTGMATGCHIHFQVIGAKNPLARYAVGATISYKK